ncbi:ABC transporter substrate-binding protein [Amycolatopsis sp. AA4]|uniref:thiamine pyrophosphate-dependent dehydrogenase E1 component subunit alpha n=1 Tax=Actinomycetes TaxID=1760 RepID=UPI0001B56AAB|nr:MULTISPECIES: thiamine pyrophosphate-dependent dehydrogenase E1 component subunit alpha [Actinomycetes]ATY11257.1 ABC transporter substrate-binding protein [Amycolatopsis sp. AA4]EFL06846.1 pyruvate dehydrogenase E1 component alpha subunit [Streptomyces sp. AA4]
MKLRLYRTMSLIRQFETAASRLMASGELAGFLHLSIGQEAVAAGVCDALDRDDYLTTTHRGHGHCLAKGANVRQMMAELFARAGGYCGGRSGSMHVADPALGILGANAIVGAGVPIALGGAFSAQVLGDARIAVTFFGEGAVAEGVVHESFNIAALSKLPIVFVCENNGYAEMTPVETHLRAASVTEYARPHRMPAESVDGNDVLAVRDAARRAVERARAGEGPTLLECRTYRWHGHFEGDAQGYRNAEEVDQWRTRDPLLVLRAHLDGTGDQLDAIDRACADEVADAIAWARVQPDASPDSLTAHVYRSKEVVA